jgi:hypothetical protein
LVLVDRHETTVAYYYLYRLGSEKEYTKMGYEPNTLPLRHRAVRYDDCEVFKKRPTFHR